MTAGDHERRSARHAVVTGTSSGIGRAIAERLLAGGWHVTGIDRAPPDWTHAGFVGLQADLAEPHALIAQLADLGTVTALVHAAGYMRVGRLGELMPDSGEGMWQVHVGAAEALANALALHQVKPVVDRVFPFSEARAAFHYMSSGAHLGKVAIAIG